MNFFESQAKAKSQTTKLIIMFIMAVCSLIVLTNLFVMGVFGYFALEDNPLTLNFIVQQFDWGLFGIIAIIVFAIVISGSLYKISNLSNGGKYVAISLGGRLVRRTSKHLQHQVLLNVVEEMAIAAGTPVPEVYLLKKEKGINAFAAGFTINDAVIGITQGALDYFTREELQGVIAHEFSHIIHGDMRLNMRLVGVLHGILVIGLIGYYILRGTGRKRGKGKIVILGLGLMVIGYGGTFFGNLIKASINRQREYLADASAVQYTRNNQGIAGALKKIGGYAKGSELEATQAPMISHAFFSSAIKSRFEGLLATHPPLEQRIKAIDPSWKGSFPKVLEVTKESPAGNRPSFHSSAHSTNLSGLVETIGQLDLNNIEVAKARLDTIPQLLKQKIYSVDGAKAVIFGLLIAGTTNQSLFNKQLAFLEETNSKKLTERLRLMMPDLRTLDIGLRLPLVEIALPQLRVMNKVEYQTFIKDLKWLTESDEEVSVFEWSLERIVNLYLKSEFDKADYKTVKFRYLHSVKAEIEIVMSVLCSHFVEPTQQKTILDKARKMIGISDIEILPDSAFTINSFAEAVDRLAFLKPDLKESVFHFFCFLVTQDNKFSTREQETIRALSACFGCPMPIS